jgi:hypothetical protein
VAALVAAATAAVALVTTLDGTSPFTTEKALAAIGDKPVVHAVVESERPSATIVDLTTGEERPQVQRTEYWHDAERGLLRARVTVDGDVVSEHLQTRQGFGPLCPAREPGLDPALAGFATRYREAPESGQAQVIGSTEVDGREVVLLRIELEPAPLAAALRGGRARRRHVQTAALSLRAGRHRRALVARPVDRDARAGEGAVRPSAPRGPSVPQSQTSTDERELTPAEAAHALDRPALWAGRAVEGIELTKIEVLRLITRWTNGRNAEGRGLRIECWGGPLQRVPRWLEIRQGSARHSATRFGPFDPGLPPGRLQLFGLGDHDGSAVDRWIGSLRTQGMFVTIESPVREVVLAAARALRPNDES